MNDRYLKGVLTIIAAALVWIGVELSVGQARAASGIDQVRLVTARGTFNRHTGEELAYLPVYCVNCR